MTVIIIDPVVQPLIGIVGFLGVVTIIYYTYRWFNKPFSREVKE